MVDRRPHEITDRDRAVAEAPLGEPEERLLGAVEEGLDVLPLLEPLLGDLAGDPDQLAQQGLLADDGRVGPELRGNGGLLHEGGQHRLPADLLEDPRPPELLRDGQGIGGLAPLEPAEHGAKDLPVTLLVEVLGLDELDRPREDRGLDENTAEHRPLRLEALRRDLPGKLDERPHAGRPSAERYSRVTWTVREAVSSPWSRMATL